MTQSLDVKIYYFCSYCVESFQNIIFFLHCTQVMCVFGHVLEQKMKIPTQLAVKIFFFLLKSYVSQTRQEIKCDFFSEIFISTFYTIAIKGTVSFVLYESESSFKIYMNVKPVVIFINIFRQFSSNFFFFYIFIRQSFCSPNRISCRYKRSTLYDDCSLYG